MCELKDDGNDPFQKSAENKASKTDTATTEDEIMLKDVTVTSSEVGDNDDYADEACLYGPELKSQVKDNILPGSNKKLPGFEVSQAEAELDMLLGSLGGADVPISSLTADQRTRTVSGLDDTLDDLLSSTSKMTKTAPGLDDGIGDLLDTTSYMTKEGNILKSGNVAATLTPRNSASSSEATKVVDEDDFDSWLETLS